MGLINFKVKSGTNIAINTNNIVSIERRENFIMIIYNVSFNGGFLRCMKGRLHSDRYEYKSEDDAIAAYNTMCQSFTTSIILEPDEKSSKSSTETL